MLQFRNETPFVGRLTLMPDADGIDTFIAVVKATFLLGTELQLAAEQVPVAAAPEYWGDPATSSLRVSPELLLPKPSTDIVVVGSAHAPNLRPVQELVVGIQVGTLQQVARVSGDRRWRRTTAGFTATPPEPWLSMPLTWERAYGGREETHGGWDEEGRNPVGTGFRASDGKSPVEGTSLPNVEHIELPMTSWDKRCEPVGFGPVSPGWLPRRLYAGTYDERWQRERAPYLPKDFDARFLQVAPPALIAPQPLVGGEPVVLHGMHSAGTLVFHLPTIPLELTINVDGASHPRPVKLDTVLIEPDEERYSLSWSASMPCDKKALRIREVVASIATAA